MTTITFDKLAYVEALKSGGVPEAQAKVHAAALDTALLETVATKADIIELKHEIEIMRRELTIRMGTAAVALAGFLTAIKYLG